MNASEYSQLFFKTNRDLVEAMKADIAQGSYEAALRKAHSFKGAALMIGASNLAEAAADMAKSLSDGDAAAALAHADTLLARLAPFQQNDS